MRTYETIFIIHPEVTADAYTEVVDKYKGILNDLDAEMIAVEEWGNRKLAYLVQKQKRGSFVLFAYKGKPDGIRELERRFRIDDKVIKFMTVLLEDGFKPSGFVSTVAAEPAKETAPESTEKPAIAAKPAAEAAPAPAEQPAVAAEPVKEAAPESAEQPDVDATPAKETEE